MSKQSMLNECASKWHHDHCAEEWKRSISCHATRQREAENQIIPNIAGVTEKTLRASCSVPSRYFLAFVLVHPVLSRLSWVRGGKSTASESILFYQNNKPDSQRNDEKKMVCFLVSPLGRTSRTRSKRWFRLFYRWTRKTWPNFILTYGLHVAFTLLPENPLKWVHTELLPSKAINERASRVRYASYLSITGGSLQLFSSRILDLLTLVDALVVGKASMRNRLYSSDLQYTETNMSWDLFWMRRFRFTDVIDWPGIDERDRERRIQTSWQYTTSESICLVGLCQRTHIRSTEAWEGSSWQFVVIRWASLMSILCWWRVVIVLVWWSSD